MSEGQGQSGLAIYIRGFSTRTHQLKSAIESTGHKITAATVKGKWKTGSAAVVRTGVEPEITGRIVK